MSGVGSTNAMKKGSANNPFLAFSEADMKGYLNSAYTGCIVKYTGDPIARNLSDINKTVPERAQSLVFKVFRKNILKANWGCLKITTKSNGTETVQYLRTFFYNRYTGEIGWRDRLDWIPFLAICNTQHPTSASDLGGLKILWVPTSYETNSDDYPEYWPVTLGWQGENADADGKVMLWGYSEDVSFVYLEDGKDSYISYDDIPCAITPYSTDELYKVVYSNNEYRYEEFHCISEDKTTAGVEDVAPGKTFYDFTGTKQIGTGTRANPFLARGDSDMNAFNNATYLGKFVKYIGKTNNTYVKDAIYQVTNDATEYDRYMLLPTLENEGTATDLAKGKQLINSQGEVVEGDAPTQGDIIALYANKQLTEFITDAEIGSIGTSRPSAAMNSFTLINQSLLSKVVLTNVKSLYTNAFYGCSNLTHLELPFGVNLDAVVYSNGYFQAGYIFPETLSYSDAYGTYVKIANWSKYDVLVKGSTYRSDYSSAKYILAGALASSYVRTSSVYLSGAMYINAYVGGSRGNNFIETIHIPNCSHLENYTFSSFTKLKEVYLDNVTSMGAAFPYCSNLTKVYCPNVEKLVNTFSYSPKLTEPYDFPKVKTFYYPYAYSISTISSINLPEALEIRLSYPGIQNVYMPKVEILALTNMQFSTISVPTCKELTLTSMPNLESIYAPNLLYCSYISNCPKLTEISFENVIAPSKSSTYQYSFRIYSCSQLKTVSLPSFSIGSIYIDGCSNLETVYAPLLSDTISITSCTLAQFSIYNAYSISMNNVIAKSDFSIYANESTWKYMYLSMKATNSERVDLYINNYSKSAYIQILSNNSVNYTNAIRNVNILVHNANISAYLYAGEHINIYASNSSFGLNFNVSYNSTVLDIKLKNCYTAGYFCYSCSNLEDVYNYEVPAFYANNYYICSKLSAVIIDGSTFTSLYGANVFSSTPITNSTYLGYYGSIYVRNSMVDTYKNNGNWKSYSSRITSITDLPQELKDKYGLNGVE